MPPGAIDERGLVLLRRKLEALNYTEPLDAGSASLVNHLVNDLIRTTDGYRSIKLQAAQYAQEVATFNTKVSTAAAQVPCLTSASTAVTFKGSFMLLQGVISSLCSYRPACAAHGPQTVFAVSAWAELQAGQQQLRCRVQTSSALCTTARYHSR